MWGRKGCKKSKYTKEEKKKLRKSKEVVFKNKVKKECPKEKKIQNGKLCWEKEREKEKKEERKSKKRVCFRIKGWGE